MLSVVVASVNLLLNLIVLVIYIWVVFFHLILALVDNCRTDSLELLGALSFQNIRIHHFKVVECSLG